jgi:hypothetical protein
LEFVFLERKKVSKKGELKNGTNFFQPYPHKTPKNIFSFGGFKGARISDLFLAKIHHFANFLKKVPSNMIKRNFWKFSKKITIFQGRKLSTHQDFWRSWGGFLAFLI